MPQPVARATGLCRQAVLPIVDETCGKGPGLHLLDGDAALGPDPATGLAPDRLHLNPHGYAALSGALARLVRGG